MITSASERPCGGCTGEGRVVCRCLHVTEEELVAALSTYEITTLQELKVLTGAGDGCTCCHGRLKEYIARYAQSSSSEPICSCKEFCSPTAAIRPS